MFTGFTEARLNNISARTYTASDPVIKCVYNKRELKMTQSQEDKIYKVMKKESKPLKPGEIAELTGIDKDVVSKLIKKLSVEGKVTSPKRCFYEAV